MYIYVQKKSKIRTAKATAIIFPSSNGSFGLFFVSWSIFVHLYSCVSAYVFHARSLSLSVSLLPADLQTRSQKANLSPLCAPAPRFFSYTK